MSADPSSSQPSSDNGSRTGLIVRKTAGGYHVELDDGQVLVCSVRSRLRKELDAQRKTTDRSATFGKQIARSSSAHGLAVGDRVEVTPAPDSEGVIDELLPRETAFLRRSPGKYARNQVMVANLEQVLVVFSFEEPTLNPAALDRFLVASGSQDLPTTIVLNKRDLTEDPVLRQQIPQIYRNIGYTVLEVSAADGTEIESVRQAMVGKLTALTGPSGVGKSSILAAIDPRLANIRVGDISRKYGKGAHTTTDVTLYRVDLGEGNSGHVVDMPGIRELGLANLDPEELDGYFPEMVPLVGECRFSGRCLHDNEPGCAVKEAVEEGTIEYGRYESYLKMLDYLTEQQKKKY